MEKSKNPKSLLGNYDYKEFLTVEGEVKVQVDDEKQQREALWDGLHGVMTNIMDKKMKSEDVLSHYHGLWQVEDSAERIREELFRVQESVLVNKDDNQKYVVPSKPSKDALKIYEVMDKKSYGAFQVNHKGVNVVYRLKVTSLIIMCL